MDIKYFGVDGAVIDERFGDPITIPELIIKSKDSILDNYLKPSLVHDKEGRDFYYPRKTEIDSGLNLEILGIYEYGIIYGISNSTESSKAKTSAKMIVASNNASFFVNSIDDKYNNDIVLGVTLGNNLKNEKIFTNALGKKIEIEKMYGARSKNKFLKIFESVQRENEEKTIEYAINSSIRVLSESLEDNKKILNKTRS